MLHGEAISKIGNTFDELDDCLLVKHINTARGRFMFYLCSLVFLFFEIRFFTWRNGLVVGVGKKSFFRFPVTGSKRIIGSRYIGKKVVFFCTTEMHSLSFENFRYFSAQVPVS